MNYAKYKAFCRVIYCYQEYWIWIVLGIIINILILFVVNKLLEKSKNLSIKKYIKKINLNRIDYLLLFMLTFIFFIWKITNISKENVDSMESFNMQFNSLLSTNIIKFLDTSIVIAHKLIYAVMLNLVQIFCAPENLVFLYRFISFGFGVLCSLLLFKFSIRVFQNKLIAYLGFILFNLNALFLFYCRRIEVYSIFCFFVLLSFYDFWRIFIDRDKNKTLRYGIWIIIVFCLHDTGVVVIFSQALALFFLNRKQPLETRNYLYLKFMQSVLVFACLFFLLGPIFCASIISNHLILYKGAWENNFYLGMEKLPEQINTMLNLIFGMPIFTIGLFSFPLFFAVFSLIKKNNNFFWLLLSILISSILFQATFIYMFYIKVNACYFNIRHLLWIVPFIIMMYSFGFCDLCFLSNKNYKKILGYSFLIIILSSGIVKSNTVIYSNKTPDYEKAFYYIKDKFKDGDFLGWLCSFTSDVFFIHTKKNDIFYDHDNTILDERSAGVIFNNIALKQKKFKRFWVIVAKEDYFGVDHMNLEFIDKCVNFLKKEFKEISCVKMNKIDIYLFESTRERLGGIIEINRRIF
ncbi:MAG: hypothetical protein ABIG64_08795 [Candidatus Omnitrophota bacterium]